MEFIPLISTEFLGKARDYPKNHTLSLSIQPVLYFIQEPEKVHPFQFQSEEDKDYIRYS